MTPIAPGALRPCLEAFRSSLAGQASALSAFDRIAATIELDGAAPEASQIAGYHSDAISLAADFGMQPLDAAPADYLSWDGRHVRTRSEPSVLIHEIAHFQLASPSRRCLPDFGLGAGPESGAIEIADRAQCLTGAAREREEQLTSLLGILWETALGQPAIAAFQEQNWLEGAGRASTAAFFISTLQCLIDAGLADAEGRPRLALNRRCDNAVEPLRFPPPCG